MRRFAFLKRSSRWEGTACGNTGRITVHVSAILTANIIAYQSELKILPKETRKTLYRKDVRVRTQTSSTVSREKKLNDLYKKAIHITEMNIFVVAALQLVAVTSAANLQDLINALNTNERTWIYQRSYVEYKGSEYVTCAYYRKLELNQTNYEFFKDFMLCSQAHQRHLYAELGDDGRDGPYMGVSTWPGAEVTSYTLRYWNATEACAVYTLDKYNTLDCELHVRHHNRKGVFIYCELYYRVYCHGKIFQIYSEACKN
nr:uncharacterized protein LOC126517516 isoform X2 [Dermacentor andersoni]